MEKHIGQNIKRYRQAKKLSLAEVSRRIGYDASNLSKIENGKVEPSIELLTKLADVYAVSLGDFFGEKRTVPAQLEGFGIDELRIIEDLPELTDDQIKQLKDFVEFLKSK